MKTVWLTIIFAITSICSLAQKQVYVCTGNRAYRYHYYKNCSGLRNCKATIVKKSLEEAKRMPNMQGLCKKCSKRGGVEFNYQASIEKEEIDSCYTCMLERKKKTVKL